MKFPTIKEMAQDVADKALDEIEYNGKTLREWIEIIASNDGDTISRKAAKDALNHEMRCGAVINQCGLEMAYEIIEDLPPAEPKMGRWIHHPEIGWGETWLCDQCGEKTTSTVMGKPRANFCPNCGSDMRGEQDG